MLRCRELSRLSRASKPRSVNFRRTTPGHIAPLLSWDAGVPKAGRLDPEHPTHQIPRLKLGQTMPNARTTAFTLRAFPQAALYIPTEPFLAPPHMPAPVRTARYNMSLPMICGKKAIHKSAAIRRAVVNKIRTAIGLIITRGAKKSVDERGREVLTFTNEPELGLVMSDWTYVMLPRLEVYRMPWPTLVDQLRTAIQRIATRIHALESVWYPRKGRLLTGKAKVSKMDACAPEESDDVLGAERDRGIEGIRRRDLPRMYIEDLEASLKDEDPDLDGLVDDWLDDSASAPPLPLIPATPAAKPTTSLSSMLYRAPVIRSVTPKTSPRR